MDILNKGIQVPPIIRQLRKILEQYPGNGQILKELIQNAEDAGAREVKFLMDETHYGDLLGVDKNDTVYHLLGPALYVYNDAKFTEEDWKGIVTFGESIKEKDPTKVGKFGLGFKSVFHFTDVPSFYSGVGAGFLDPHSRYLPERRNAYAWFFDNDVETNCPGRNLFHKEVYQTSNFCSCCDIPRNEYQHTLFRFPLRCEDAKSDLAGTSYSQEKIYQLLDTLSIEAYMNLLFMKNLEKIEIYRRSRRSELSELLFKVEIMGESLSGVRLQRTKLKEHTCITKTRWHNEPLTVVMDMSITTLKEGLENQCTWSVCHFIDGGTRQTELSSLFHDDDVHLLPWVGVAAFRNASSTDQFTKGHVFSFLPLPLPAGDESLTGLPLHVHGHFALDHTRHHIKWPSKESVTDCTEKSVKWNTLLVKETLPEAYIKLLRYFQKMQLPNQVHTCLPAMSSTKSEWKKMLDSTYCILAESDLFCTTGKAEWVTPSCAFLISHKESLRKILIDVLVQANQLVVDLPPVTEETVILFKLPFKTLDLVTLRGILRRQDAASLLSDKEKVQLLTHILADKCYDDLQGIPLLPLADGTFTTFQSKAPNNIFVCLDRKDVFDLLPGLQSHFVKVESLPPKTWMDLIESGKFEKYR